VNLNTDAAKSLFVGASNRVLLFVRCGQ
jgi:hypothetical protein